MLAAALLVLQEVKETDAVRLEAIWLYWEQDDAPSSFEAAEDELHPDHRPPSS